MMRPNDFKLNSDYLSIAQTGRIEHTFTFAGGTLEPNGQAGFYTDQKINLNITTEPGAIDRFMIKVGNNDFYVGSQSSLHPATGIYGFFDLHRINKSTMQAQLVLENFSTTTASYPLLTIRVKITSFRPPNVF